MTNTDLLDDEGFTRARPVHVASGGKLLRRYRRNADATRDLAPARRHGARGRSPNFMRPPSAGHVDYQDPNGKRAPRIYTGAIDAVTKALGGLE
jgi:hypothetical protein